MWDVVKQEEVPMPVKVKRFLDDYESLCYKYGLSLAHEDSMGSFVVENYDEANIEWAKGANLGVI